MRIVERYRLNENTYLYSSCGVGSLIGIGIFLGGLVLAFKYDIFNKAAHLLVAILSVVVILITLVLFLGCKCKKEVLGGLAIAGAFGGFVALLINLL